MLNGSPEMPKKTLGDIEKFYIREHKHLTSQEIASKLDGIGPKTVESYLDTLDEGEQGQENIATAKSEDSDGHKAGNLLSRNEEYGVVVMTQEASELADAHRSAVNTEEGRSNTSDRIHRIRND